MEYHDKLIITAASEEYGKSLLSLLGSINLNWPNHPDILVYDIGLSAETLGILQENNIECRQVPAFCPHWRKHFTWKIWCINDAPAKNILWIDAGVVILKPLDEVFNYINTIGYFLVPNYQLLDWEASIRCCFGCNVSPDFRYGKPTLAATMMGYRKEGTIKQVLTEALDVALVEENIAATEPTHRHDQAILSILMYKYFVTPQISDGLIYLGWKSPLQVNGQKVWVHRRSLSEKDMAYFTSHISKPGLPHFPSAPLTKTTKNISKSDFLTHMKLVVVKIFQKSFSK